MRHITVLIALGAALFAQQAAAEEIHLVCSGDSSRSMIDATANVSGSNGRGGFVDGSATSEHREHQADEVYVDIVDGQGRIKLPDSLIPILNGHSADGWRNFESLSVGADTITGKVSLNLINHPKISISRLTGRIAIEEVKRSFSGQCDPYDPKTVARKF
ncbi:MAG TPA: hypothetical protein VGL66_12000 [Caulobacteraceae bacterium]|jgi:hypothetical protein